MQIPEYITKDEVNKKGMNINSDDFKQGLEVELEHGLRFDDANVTNNHPIITGKIVLAHMKESLDYYKLLEVAEVEGDLLKAIQSDNMTVNTTKHRKKLRRYNLPNHARELIFSCYRRYSYFSDPVACILFLHSVKGKTGRQN